MPLSQWKIVIDCRDFVAGPHWYQLSRGICKEIIAPQIIVNLLKVRIDLSIYIRGRSARNEVTDWRNFPLCFALYCQRTKLEYYGAPDLVHNYSCAAHHDAAIE